jgi:hypothetical protein
MDDDEYEAAARTIRDLGQDPADFEFLHEDPSHKEPGSFPVFHKLTIRNRKTDASCEYQTGGGSEWSIVFGQDLIAGKFR